MIRNILDYWYKIEYFTPCWPINKKKDININNMTNLPWTIEKENNEVKLSYDLYCGQIKSIDLIRWMLSKTDEKEDERIEVDNTNTCIFAFKVDENGYYVAKSFSVSSFVWAVCKIVSSFSIKVELDPQESRLFENDMNEYIINHLQDQSLDKATLENILIEISNILQLPRDLFSSSIWARKKTQKMKKDGSFPPIEPSTELFQSFYLNDMKNVSDNLNERIKKYILAELQETPERILIDSNIDEMKSCLSANNYPLGVWPGKYDPSLMQQIGINLSTRGYQDIFSINGPPGTGKTTLLKEIVASNVIERAKVLVSYDKPDSAFKRVEFKNPCDQYNRFYYCMDNRLKKFGILVASNNNAAVENISVNLPKFISKDRTGLFSKNIYENSDDIYFSDVASKLIGEPAWGLISAKLGKKENLYKLKDRLWWSKDKITLKRYYDEEECDWNIVRNNFNEALQKVLDERERIAYAQSLLEKEAFLVSAIKEDLETYKQIKIHLQNKKIISQQENEKLFKLKEEVNSINSEITLQKLNMSLLEKLFKYNDNAIKLRNLNTHMANVRHAVYEQERACKLIEDEIHQLENRKIIYSEKLDSNTKALNNIRANIHSEKAKYKDSCRDNDKWGDKLFWANITKNSKSQETCPWVYDRYNELREELFYQALQVNKAFVLLSNSVKQNLQRIFSLWDGKYTAEDRQSSYGELLNTLLLVIPVISTTFASVEKFLLDIGEDELGLLVIDEAGQATPQSALGALWRCQRAIIVGDPLQVEPVLTVPKELIKRFANEYNIPANYRLPELSVQMLADAGNKYGGYRNVNGNDIWLGCPLVVHRRCISPMFEISNEVAYDNKMFYMTNPPDNEEVFALKISEWFDVRGKENNNKDHTVQNQIEFTKKLFRHFIEVYKGLPDMYIITPFKSVAESLKKMMRSVLSQTGYDNSKEVNEWVNEHCGTVHTFQGKEAREVVLVLGCDSQTGVRAASWVGQKPNIINVAVSRAKFRIAVVGDYDLWKNIPNVQVICQYLKVRRKNKFSDL